MHGPHIGSLSVGAEVRHYPPFPVLSKLQFIPGPSFSPNFTSNYPQYGNGTVVNLATIEGEQGPQWKLSSSPFPSTTEGVRLRVTGKRGYDYLSDIAIDDLSVGNCAGESCHGYTPHSDISPCSVLITS